MIINENTKIPLGFFMGSLGSILSIGIWINSHFVDTRRAEDLDKRVTELKQDQQNIKEDIKKILEYTFYIKGKLERGR